MLLVNALLELDLPLSHSLKGRRKILNALKERLQKRNLSILDLSSDYPKEATLAICFLALSEPEALKKLQGIEREVERLFPELDYSLSYELL
ncbi:MAG: DUF503 domain-containing protein [Nitratiruptor sp.]|nr:DUF503 domain-containing protein [Nitratiruptor sp.]NPA84161.1 DUF503 domain-containing protein [Campylobacterota bacterium]